MFTFATTPVLGGPGYRAVTVDLLTTYEGAAESAAVVLAPPYGEPIVLWPGTPGRTLPLAGTFVVTVGTWDAARELLELLTRDVYLLREDGHGVPDDAGADGTGPLRVLPRRVRHRVLPDELDMHEITIEWVRLGGGY